MLISIVVPCFNEEEVLPETIERLCRVTDKIKTANLVRLQNFTLESEDSKSSRTDFISKSNELSFELIFVNDGSRDNTLKILKDYAKKDPRIKVINFSKNFGHQIAVTAGMDAANGEATVLIDADLQDPPELIEEMVELWLNGYDVVYATRTKRLGEGYFKEPLHKRWVM